MRKAKYLLEYAAVRLLAAMALLLPWASLAACAEFLGRLAALLARSRSRLIHRNLLLAFPELDENQRRVIARDFWRNFTLNVLEWLQISSLTTEWIGRNVLFENAQVLDLALGEGRGVLLHSGHFGNFEYCSMALSTRYQVAAVAKTQKNPYLDAWHNKNRGLFNMRILNHHQAVRETQEWLRNNGCVGILMDQNLYKGGIFVDFFGKPAATTSLTALLHLRTQSPIIGVYSRRQGLKHRVRFERIEAPFWNGSLEKNEKARRLTQLLTNHIEKWVREEPANWLWGHNRWKRMNEARVP